MWCAGAKKRCAMTEEGSRKWGRMEETKKEDGETEGGKTEKGGGVGVRVEGAD